MSVTTSNMYATFLLALVAWREARGESPEAQLGVMWSVKNRAARPSWWGNSVVSVVLKPFQYSSFNPNDPNAVKLPAEDDPVWNEIETMAVAPGADPTGGATHYFSTDIPAPSWTSEMTFTVQIGALRFYR
jgi:N-acetylmuramoyl-L-alanine amidase